MKKAQIQGNSQAAFCGASLHFYALNNIDIKNSFDSLLGICKSSGMECPILKPYSYLGERPAAPADEASQARIF